MRTLAQIARALGWPEAKAAQEVVVDLVGPMSKERMRRIIARSRKPHLRVHRSKCTHPDGTARWLWEVHAPNTTCLAWGDGRTHGEALAVGLAALDTASMRSAR